MSYIYPEDTGEPAVLPRPEIDGVKRPRFVLRTIVNGSVRIYGRDYRPDAHRTAYDGRLDGQRFAFGLYHNRPDLICLWGTQAAYETVAEGVDWPGPECVDGKFPWTFWSTGTRDASPRTDQTKEDR